MNRRRIWRTSILVAPIVTCWLSPYFVSTSWADDISKRHQEIADIYKHLEKAFRSRDANAMVAVCSADYQATFPNGRKMDRSSYASNYTRQMSAIQEVHAVHIVPSQFVDRSSETIVTLTSSLTARTVDALKAAHEINSVVHAKDTWARKNNTWRLVRSEVLQQSLTQDGKTVLFQSASGAKPHG